MDGPPPERRQVVFPRGVYIALWIAGIGYVLYWLRAVLTPVFLAFAMAYVFDPLIDRLERLRIPRGLAVTLVMAVLVSAVTLAVVLVLPNVVADVASVVRELPTHIATALARVEPWLAQYDVKLPQTTSEWVAQLQGKADVASGALLASAGDVVTWLVGGTLSFFGAIAAALIVPVFAIYMLYDFDRIVAGVRDLTPLRYRRVVMSYAVEIDHVLGQFIRGQLIIMAIMAVLYGGAYTALEVRLAIPIGIGAGLLNFIPYLGSAFALVSGLVMSLIGGGGWAQIIGVIIAYTVVQSLEGFVITPRVVGKTVGLRDVWVLFALFVGGEIFGFMGVLLALPIAAVAKVFIRDVVAYYQTSELYATPSSSVAPPPPGSLPPERRTPPSSVPRPPWVVPPEPPEE